MQDMRLETKILYIWACILTSSIRICIMEVEVMCGGTNVGWHVGAQQTSKQTAVENYEAEKACLKLVDKMLFLLETLHSRVAKEKKCIPTKEKYMQSTCRI